MSQQDFLRGQILRTEVIEFIPKQHLHLPLISTRWHGRSVGIAIVLAAGQQAFSVAAGVDFE